MMNNTMMNREFTNAATVAMNMGDADVRRDVIVNTMASRMNGVSRSEIQAYVGRQLAARETAISDFSF